MEEVDRNRSNSRDPLTPEPQDPAPQKKKKKKKPSVIGSNIFTVIHTTLNTRERILFR